MKVDRAIVLRRVSGDEQFKGGHSLDSQQEDCFAYAAEKGYAVVADLCEVNSGDYLDERDGLWEARQMMRRKEAEVLVVWKLDRLSRNTDYQSVILYEAGKYEVRVESVLEVIDDTPAGRLNRQIRGIVADLERQNIRERSMRGRKRRAEAGEFLPGRKAPYAYRWADDRKTKLEKDPQTEHIMDEIIVMLRNGWGLREVARHLTTTGVATPMGGKVWSSQALKYILKNPCLIGKPTAFRLTHRQRRETDGITGRVKLYDTVVDHDPSRHVPLPVESCPAYTDAETMTEIWNNIRARRKGAGGKTFNPENYLLRRGYLRCGYCGNTMTCRVKDGRYPAYACTAGCFFSVHAHKVDRYAWEAIARVLRSPEPMLRALEDYMASNATPAERSVEAWTAEVAHLEIKSANYAANLGEMSGDAAADIRALHMAAKDRIKHLKVEIAKSQAEVGGWMRVMASIKQLLEACRTLGDLDTLPYAQKRLALYILGVEVTAFRKGTLPDRWTVEFLPFDKRCWVDKNTTIVFPLQPFYDVIDAMGLRVRVDGTEAKVRVGGPQHLPSSTSGPPQMPSDNRP